MEPIAYIISLFYSLLGYTYFMATKGGVFDLQPFKEFWQTHYKVRGGQGWRAALTRGGLWPTVRVWVEHALAAGCARWCVLMLRS